MFMPFFLSSSTVLMACFCVKHLHNSQGCQKGDLYLLCLSVHMHVRTHMRIHTLLQIPASVFWQRQGACSHLILTGKGKFWENLAAPWWWSTDSTYHQLQDHFRLWPVSMVSIFPESVIEPRGWQGFSCCTTLLLPSAYCERPTGKWKIGTKMLTFRISQCDRMISIKFWKRMVTIRLRQSIWQRSKCLDLFKLTTIPQAPLVICKMGTINPTW